METALLLAVWREAGNKSLPVKTTDHRKDCRNVIDCRRALQDGQRFVSSWSENWAPEMGVTEEQEGGGVVLISLLAIYPFSM